MKKLYRSKDNVMLTGLLAGVGDYLNIDPVVVRLLFIIFLLLTGIFPGVIIYLIALLFVPSETERVTVIDVE